MTKIVVDLLESTHAHLYKINFVLNFLCKIIVWENHLPNSYKTLPIL